MALRHSVRHLDPHGHRHGPRCDELHGGRIALALRFAARPAQRSTAIIRNTAIITQRAQHNAVRPPTNATRPKARALGRAYEEVVPTM